MGYLLSIVVPTKDRYPYLKHLMELIKGFKSDEIELVIQDNTYNNAEILEYLKELDYPHLKYFYTKEHLSVSDNSTKAILNSSGKYICCIGDDDGVVRNIVEVTRWMHENNLDALTSKVVEYNWPDYEDNSRYHMSGVVYSLINHRKSQYVDVKKSIKDVINDGFGSMKGLPKVYQGIVKRECLDKVYKKYGSFFPGPSPDMANAFALAFVAKKVYYLDTPVIITGQCRSVGGGEILLHGCLKKIDEIPFLPKNILDTWDNHMPQLWCSDTIWPQSAIEVLNRRDEEYNYNYERIFARFVYHHPNYSYAINLNNCNRFAYLWYLSVFHLNNIMNGIITRLQYLLFNNKIVNSKKVVRNVTDIIMAENIIFNGL